MLERILIENFRCLKEVEVPLRPLTVLVGPNDSGKSAFLAALRHLAEPIPFTAEDYWRLNLDAIVSVKALTTSNQNVGVIGGPRPQIDSLAPPGSTRITPEEHIGTFAYPKPIPFCSVAIYQLPAHGIDMESTGHSDVGQPPIVGPNGEMIPALLDHVLRNDRKRFEDVRRTLEELIPGFEDLRIATPSPKNRRVDLVIENGLTIAGNEASAGVRLLIFFVALAYHPSPSKLILIEEPENGVHPKRLEDVMRLLREITEGRHGDHAAQIVLTTHSPHLLDYVDIEKDQVLVFRRNDDGSRTAEPADAERLKTFLDEFMLGEVWYNEGEAGLVGPAK